MSMILRYNWIIWLHRKVKMLRECINMTECIGLHKSQCNKPCVWEKDPDGDEFDGVCRPYEDMYVPASKVRLNKNPTRPTALHPPHLKSGFENDEEFGGGRTKRLRVKRRHTKRSGRKSKTKRSGSKRSGLKRRGRKTKRSWIKKT